MHSLVIKNPFGGPVYYIESCTSTMDFSKELAKKGEVPGTVIVTGFQESGRGRNNRTWFSEKECNLLFTLMMLYEDFYSMPSVFTLKAGLALVLALETIFPLLAGRIKIKWPNDIMIDGKKAAGILTETVHVSPGSAVVETGSGIISGTEVYLGMGINIGQKNFPPELADTATSLAKTDSASTDKLNFESGNALLEKILFCLFNEFNFAEYSGTWKNRLEQKLFKINEEVYFIKGQADSGNFIKGIITGVDDQGFLSLVPCGECNALFFNTGEITLKI